jgi:predicted metal-dependent hydrolase
MHTTSDFLELATRRGGTIKVLKAVHPRARRLRISVTPDGARVSYPRGTRPAKVYAFLRENSDWLERKLSELQVSRRAAPRLRIGVPTVILVRGAGVKLSWQIGESPRLEDRGHELRVHVARPLTTAMPVARNLLAAHLETGMRRDLARWMAEAVKSLNAAPTGLRIKPLKSLWGSLDAHDRISLDLALAMAPPVALRYVLVHEMCHLKVRNHSPRFWARVGELLPGYQLQRDWLRQHGARLKAETERLLRPAR